MRTDADRAAEALERRVAKSLAALLPPGAESLLVALSGGADSVALLLLTEACAKKSGWRVGVIHVHHGIRGAEADRDAAFCRALCAARGIPFFLASCDVPALAKAARRGIEETARAERYRLIEEIRVRERYDVALTAHHADDQLETLLFRLVRGSGTAGMRGILPMRGNVCRPLLGISRAELTGYLAARGAEFVTDSTNADPHYARNFLRQTVIPPLTARYPEAPRAAARLAAAFGRDEAFFAAETAKIPPCPTLAQLSALPDALAIRVLAREFAAISPQELSFDHAEALLRLLRAGRTAQRLSLPGAIAVRERECIRFVREEELCAPAPFCLPLAEGETLLPDGSRVFRADSPETARSAQNVYNFAIRAELNSATIKEPICVRSRLPGDTLRYGGATHPFKKLMQSRGISGARRDVLPVFCAGDIVLWIPYCPVRDGYGADTDGAETVLFYLPVTGDETL